MSIKGIVVSVLVGALAGTASAQTPSPGEAEQVRVRQRISTMEGVLQRAVANGAENLLRQVRSLTPDVPIFTGVPQARGFRLDGYGVFFDVGVPGLRTPVTWQLRAISAELADTRPALSRLRELIADAKVDRAYRDQLELAVQQLEVQLQSQFPAPRVVVRRPPRPGVSAAPVSQGTAALSAAPAAPVEPDVLIDPDLAYTREIRAALIDAMLENSGPLAIGPDEWLTVAARDNLPGDPLIPGDMTASKTVILRIKGADLAALHARRITLEEARKRIEASEQ